MKKIFNIHNKFHVYLLIFFVSVITAGGSILYFYNVAKNSDTPIAREYPAPSTSVAHDNIVLVKNILEHHVFSLKETAPFEPDAWRTPGYPIFALPFYVIFHSFYPILFVQIILLFLTAILIFKMATKVLGEWWALVLTLLYLLLPDTMLSASALTTENLFVFIFVVALYIFFFSELKNIWLRWGLTGFLFALATYVRPASLYILFFFIPAYFILYIKWKDISRAQILAALFMIFVYMGVLAPWCIRNERVFNNWSFASTGANVLLRQNAAQFYQSITGLTPVESRNVLLIRAGIAPGPVPIEFEYYDVMKKVALQVIFEHPFKYAIFHLTTFVPFFTSSGAHEYWRFAHDMMPNFNPPPEPSLIQALRPFSLSVLVTVVKNHGWTLVENFFWLVITLFAVFSLWWSGNVRMSRMFMAIIIYFAVVTGPIAHARYRIPIEPILLLISFAAVSFLWVKYKHKIKKIV